MPVDKRRRERGGRQGVPRGRMRARLPFGKDPQRHRHRNLRPHPRDGRKNALAPLPLRNGRQELRRLDSQGVLHRRERPAHRAQNGRGAPRLRRGMRPVSARRGGVRAPRLHRKLHAMRLPHGRNRGPLRREERSRKGDIAPHFGQVFGRPPARFEGDAVHSAIRLLSRAGDRRAVLEDPVRKPRAGASFRGVEKAALKGLQNFRRLELSARLRLDKAFPRARRVLRLPAGSRMAPRGRQCYATISASRCARLSGRTAKYIPTATTFSAQGRRANFSGA